MHTVGQVKAGQNSFFILAIRMLTRNLDNGLYRYSIINISLFPLCSSHNNVIYEFYNFDLLPFSYSNLLSMQQCKILVMAPKFVMLPSSFI